jgi:hypothetical protein
LAWPVGVAVGGSPWRRVDQGQRGHFMEFGVAAILSRFRGGGMGPGLWRQHGGRVGEILHGEWGDA